LPESRFERQYAGSPSEKAALEEKAQTSFFGWPVDAAPRAYLHSESFAFETWN